VKPHQDDDLIERFAGEIGAAEGGRELAARTLGVLHAVMGAGKAWVLAPGAAGLLGAYAATTTAESVPVSLPGLWNRHRGALSAGRSVTALVPDVSSAVLTLMPVRSEHPPRLLGLLVVEDPSPSAGSADRLAHLRRFAGVLARVLRAEGLDDLESLGDLEPDHDQRASKPA